MDPDKAEMDFSIYYKDISERHCRIPELEKLYNRKLESLRILQSGILIDLDDAVDLSVDVVMEHLLYLPDLHQRVTVAFWTSLPHTCLSSVNALLSGFCPSDYDFAIPSSRPHLTM